MRYKKCCGKQFPNPTRILPTKDELNQHIIRSNYQTLIWKTSLEVDPQIPQPDGYGSDLEDGCLRIHWMDNQLAPEEILEMVDCNCQKAKCVD